MDSPDPSNNLRNQGWRMQEQSLRFSVVSGIAIRSEGSDRAIPTFIVPTSTPSSRGLMVAICLYTFPSCFGERKGITIRKMSEFPNFSSFSAGEQTKKGSALGICVRFSNLPALASSVFLVPYTPCNEARESSFLSSFSVASLFSHVLFLCESARVLEVRERIEQRFQRGSAFA